MDKIVSQGRKTTETINLPEFACKIALLVNGLTTMFDEMSVLDEKLAHSMKRLAFRLASCRPVIDNYEVTNVKDLLVKDVHEMFSYRPDQGCEICADIVAPQLEIRECQNCARTLKDAQTVLTTTMKNNEKLEAKFREGIDRLTLQLNKEKEKNVNLLQLINKQTAPSVIGEDQKGEDDSVEDDQDRLLMAINAYVNDEPKTETAVDTFLNDKSKKSVTHFKKTESTPTQRWERKKVDDPDVITVSPEEFKKRKEANNNRKQLAYKEVRNEKPNEKRAPPNGNQKVVRVTKPIIKNSTQGKESSGNRVSFERVGDEKGEKKPGNYFSGYDTTRIGPFVRDDQPPQYSLKTKDNASNDPFGKDISCKYCSEAHPITRNVINDEMCTCTACCNGCAASCKYNK